MIVVTGVERLGEGDKMCKYDMMIKNSRVLYDNNEEGWRNNFLHLL